MCHSGRTQGVAFILLIFYFLFFLPFLWAASAAYGGSQARGRIGAVAEGVAFISYNTKQETNLTRNNEVSGSSPGLTQWVNDPALP